MLEVYVVNFVKINPLRCAIGVGLLTVGHVVVIDLLVREVQLNRLVSLRFSVVLEESSCLVNDFSGILLSLIITAYTPTRIFSSSTGTVY